MVEKERARSRPIIKSVAFSEVEWEAVERRMTLAGDPSFGDLARQAILENKIVVRRESPFDSRELGAELSRIGNNINQIARSVNTEHTTTLEQMTATRAMVREIQAAIETAIEKSARDEQAV